MAKRIRLDGGEPTRPIDFLNEQFRMHLAGFFTFMEFVV
jgi:hypothetical protein